MQRQRDAAGLVTFDDRIRTVVPPSIRPGHLNAVLHALDAIVPGTRTDARRPLAQIADAMSSRGLVVLISDLLDESSSIVTGLKHLRSRGSDVLVFHVLDTHELTFPFERPVRFKDLEDGVEVLAHPDEIRQGYLAAINALVGDYRRELGAAGIDYQLVDTSKPLDEALLAYLSTRGRRS